MATWTLRPNSVLPDAMAQHLPYGGGTLPRSSIVHAWNTSVLDTNRQRVLLLRTGGHADGAHNGVRAYSLINQTWQFLKADSLAYTRMTDPLPPGSAFSAIYGDGTPAAVHTYGSVCYMPPPFDRVWSGGGIYWSPGGASNGVSFEYDLNTNTWAQIPNRHGNYGTMAVWDPVTSRVLFRTDSGFWAYTPAPSGPGTYAVQFSLSYPGAASHDGSALAFDVVGRKIYFSNMKTAAPFRLRMIDLNNLALRDQTIPTTGDTAVELVNGLGMFWDSGRIVAYGKTADGLNGALYTIDPTVGTWVRQTNTGTLPPPPSSSGTWMKFFKHETTYNFLHRTGLFTITPDGGTVPTFVSIKVASDFTVDDVLVTPPPIPPDPPGGVNPIPVNTWTMVPTLPVGTPVTTRSGKHQRVVWDAVRSRHLIAGGDRLGSDGGQPAVEAYDATTGLATLISPQCVPAPGLMPNFPDNVGWAYDTRRDRMLMFPGFYFKQASSIRPAGTLTPAATTGTDVLFTASSAVFAEWHATGNAGAGFPLKQTSSSGGSTIIAAATITTFVSTTQVRATITTAFASTAAIPTQQWLISAAMGGSAATRCGRNRYAGDTGVLDGDAVFNPSTNLWERPTWPVSPIGLGNDFAGPTWAVYDDASDAVYQVKGGGPLLILHCATNTWETVTFAAGMVAGAEKNLVQNRNSYRSQLQVANGVLYMLSNRGGSQCLIGYTIATRTWHAWAVPVGYGTIPDDKEPQLVYDPISNVLLHPWSNDLTSPVGPLYIFDIPTQTWITRAVPALAEPVISGCAVWDWRTLSMMIMGRRAVAVPGYVCYHYRYEP